MERERITTREAFMAAGQEHTSNGSDTTGDEAADEHITATQATCSPTTISVGVSNSANGGAAQHGCGRKCSRAISL